MKPNMKTWTKNKSSGTKWLTKVMRNLNRRIKHLWNMRKVCFWGLRGPQSLGLRLIKAWERTQWPVWRLFLLFYSFTLLYYSMTSFQNEGRKWSKLKNMSNWNKKSNRTDFWALKTVNKLMLCYQIFRFVLILIWSGMLRVLVSMA